LSSARPDDPDQFYRSFVDRTLAFSESENRSSRLGYTPKILVSISSYALESVMPTPRE
jgi:hypothetical protein